MKITISDFYGRDFSTTLSNDAGGHELDETFDRLKVMMGYPTNIRCHDGGHYELKYINEESE